MTAKIGTTKPSFDSKVPIASGITIDITRDAWENLGKTYVGLVELEVCERTEPSDFDTDRKVKLRVIGIELARTDETVEELRDQMRAMYAARTGEDSLFDQEDHGGSDKANEDTDDDTKVTITHNGRSVDTTTGELHAVADHLGADT